MLTTTTRDEQRKRSSEAFEQVAEAIERWGRELVEDGEKKRRRPA